MTTAKKAAPEDSAWLDTEAQLVPIEYIERRIYLLREQKVMLDSDFKQRRARASYVPDHARQLSIPWPPPGLSSVRRQSARGVAQADGPSCGRRGERSCPPSAFVRCDNW
jgi:hypothetical protein